LANGMWTEVTVCQFWDSTFQSTDVSVDPHVSLILPQGGHDTFGCMVHQGWETGLENHATCTAIKAWIRDAWPHLF
jgi:hypothetical protein